MHRKSTTLLRIIAFTLVTSLFVLLAACGGAETESPAEPTAIQSTQPTTAPAEIPTEENAPTIKAPTQEPAATDVSPTSPAVTSGATDLGFRPDVNGFSFENYGNENRTNLTPAEMVRLFGEQVCATKQDGECILTPTAEQWMQEQNNGMNGGHCEGLAALSLVLFNQIETPDTFGASQTNALQIDGNEQLQREIAYYFATQATEPASLGETRDKTPNDVLELLQTTFAQGKNAPESYTMGIYQPEFKNGHAITPYAVREKGGGVFDVLVYDNNFPNTERILTIDHNTNTWSYTASTNPNEPEALYEGSAETKTLTLTPTSPRLNKQICTFCAQSSNQRVGGNALAQPRYVELWLEGEGDLLVTNNAGKHFGYINGKFVNEIPEMNFQPRKSADLFKDDEEPVYRVPVGMKFTATIDGSQLEEATATALTIIGPGYSASVDSIELAPKQQDTFTFAGDGTSFQYTPGADQSVDIEITYDSQGPDYAIEAQGLDVTQNDTIGLSVNPATGKATLDSPDKTTDDYALKVLRVDDSGKHTFTHKDAQAKSDAEEIIAYGDWDGTGELTLGYDDNGDGTVDESVTYTDDE